MKVILHMGNPKTGSTAIQNFLLVNQTVLIDHGIYYGDVEPAPFYSHTYLTYGVLKLTLEKLSMFDFVRSFPLWEHLPDTPVNLLKTIRAHALEHNCDTVILSHEAMFTEAFRTLIGLYGTNFRAPFPDEALFAKVHRTYHTVLLGLLNDVFLSGCENAMDEDCVKYLPILFLRRQDSYLKSAYNQFLKCPWYEPELPNMPSFAEFYEHRPLTLHYYDAVQTIAEIYGADSVTIASYRSFVSESNELSISPLCLHFLELIEADLPVSLLKPTDSKAINPALSREMCEFVYRFIPPEKSFDPKFESLIASYSAAFPGNGSNAPSPVDFPNELFDVLRNIYKDENEKINSLFMKAAADRLESF